MIFIRLDLYYGRIDLSEGVDPTKSNKRKDWMICHDRFFIMDSRFKILYAMVAII